MKDDYEVKKKEEGWNPCPLCGETNILVVRPTIDDTKWKAVCQSCKVIVPGCMSEDELKKKWNKE